MRYLECRQTVKKKVQKVQSRYTEGSGNVQERRYSGCVEVKLEFDTGQNSVGSWVTVL